MSDLNELLKLVDGSIAIREGRVEVKDAAKLRGGVNRLVQTSALESGKGKVGRDSWFDRRLWSWASSPVPSTSSTWRCGRGETPNTFTVPAMNLRVLSYHAARAVFRVAKRMNAGAFIFEIARSEMGYTDQEPAEYTTNILAAAVAEGWTGPVFIQGDHFQLSPKKYAADPQGELKSVKDLISEAIAAGFYNIDVDTSTLVDISKASVPEQQATNISLSAELASHIRELEPGNVTISIGGEIGEVGGHNSTAEELRAFMDGFNSAMKAQAQASLASARSASRPEPHTAERCCRMGRWRRSASTSDTLRTLPTWPRRDVRAGWNRAARSVDAA